jgi:hypothetical protein
MIGFFKSQQPATLFVIPLVVFILWFQAFFNHPFIVEYSAPLYALSTIVLKALPSFVQVLIAVALISTEGIYLNNLMNRYEVLYKNSYLPAFMYALMMSLASPLLLFHPLILANLFLIRALDKIFALFKNESPISQLFDSGFLIAIASLFYFPAASFFILFLVSLSILRPLNFREWMIAFTGFLLPYFFLSVYFFWTNQLKNGWKTITSNYLPQHLKIDFVLAKPLIILLTVLGLLFLLSLNLLRQNFYKNVIRTRSNQQILLLFFVLAAASSFLLQRISFYHFTLLAIPLSAFFAYYFLAAKRRAWLTELLMWLVVIVIAWNHF